MNQTKINKQLLNLLEKQRVEKTLQLNDQIIGDEGCYTLKQFLLQNPNQYFTIQITGNNITGTGFAEICEGLKEQKELKQINAEWNFLGSNIQGLESFSRLLAENQSIESIDLKNNKLLSNAGPAIAQILKQSKFLKQLDLKWNELGDRGASKIIEALKQNKTIVYLDISCNKLNAQLLVEVKQLLETNQKYSEDQKQAQTALQALQPAAAQRFYDPISIYKTSDQSTFKLTNQAGTPVGVGNYSEIELMLENERQNSKQIREQCEKEKEYERQMRQNLENTIIKIKEECKQKDNSLVDQSEREKKIQTNYTNLKVDYEALKQGQIYMEENYSQIIKDLEEKLNVANNQLLDISTTHQKEMNMNISQQQEFIQKMNNSNEMKYRDLQDKYINLSKEKEILIQKLAELEQNNMETRQHFEQMLNQIHQRAALDEQNKSNQTVKGLEDQLKSIQQRYEDVSTRNNLLTLELNEKSKEIVQLTLNQDHQSQLLKDQLQQSQTNLIQLTADYNNLEQNLQNQIQLNQQLQQDVESLKAAIEDEKFQFAGQMNSLIMEQDNDRIAWNEQTEQMYVKIQQNEELIKHQQEIIYQADERYRNFCQLVQNTMDQTMNQQTLDYHKQIVRFLF